MVARKTPGSVLLHQQYGILFPLQSHTLKPLAHSEKDSKPSILLLSVPQPQLKINFKFQDRAPVCLTNL